MLPYLEAFYQYGGADMSQSAHQWSSEEDELFHSPDSRRVPSTSQSLASTDTISERRSCLSSQEDGNSSSLLSDSRLLAIVKIRY